MIEATVILDSIGPTAAHSRLHTQLWVYPKFVHQESLRHRRLCFTDWQERDFSFSVSSARAIPFAKLLEEAESPDLQAKPVKWGAEKKGMSPGGEISDPTMADFEWQCAALDAGKRARYLAELGVHKSICNRLIEPFIHVRCLVTGTTDGWLNFFGLRLDQAADPTLRALAETAWNAWSKSQPQVLKPNEWHLPFVSDEDLFNKIPWRNLTLENLQKISVARCARLSYTSFSTSKRSTIEEDLDLYQRLVGSLPIHASPAEHQATPDVEILSDGFHYGWQKPHLSGNLGPGWRQYRKMLSGEAIAPLPATYHP